ncbi:MAG: hypothetical protein ACFCU3_09055 [Verrucomicrobiales bacterium]
MIANRHGTPLLELEDGSLAHLESGWLRGSLLRAAKGAGYQKWWLADEVGHSVMQYFEHSVKDRVVPFERIVGAVREVLSAIGYADVAQHYRPAPPPLKIDLEQIALKVGEGYEISFFPILEKELEKALKASSRNLLLEHLRACVKILLQVKQWTKPCEQLRQEIVAFSRSYVARHAEGRSVTLMVT